VKRVDRSCEFELQQRVLPATTSKYIHCLSAHNLALDGPTTTADFTEQTKGRRDLGKFAHDLEIFVITRGMFH
jgi:hypothetical protein